METTPKTTSKTETKPKPKTETKPKTKPNPKPKPKPKPTPQPYLKKTVFDSFVSTYVPIPRPNPYLNKTEFDSFVSTYVPITRPDQYLNKSVFDSFVSTYVPITRPKTGYIRNSYFTQVEAGTINGVSMSDLSWFEYDKILNLTGKFRNERVIPFQSGNLRTVNIRLTLPPGYSTSIPVNSSVPGTMYGTITSFANPVSMTYMNVSSHNEIIFSTVFSNTWTTPNTRYEFGFSISLPLLTIIPGIVITQTLYQ